MILLDISSEGIDFIDAGDGFENGGKNPVLDRPQIGQILDFFRLALRHFSFQSILVYLTHSRSHRSHGNADAFWDFFPGFHQAFENELPREIDVHPVFEDDGDYGQAEFGDRPELGQPGKAAHGHFDRVGDELFHFEG